MKKSVLILFLAGVMFAPAVGLADAEIVEVSCPSCGYLERFAQGSTPADRARNIQRVIVVCERNRTIRSILLPLDPNLPVEGEPLVARQDGAGRSKLLNLELPKFLIPGNTCPLFPITAYLESNICPVDGQAGVRYGIVGQY